MTSTPDFIEVYPEALPADLCDRLIETFDNHPEVYQGRTGSGVEPDKKLSTDLMLDQHESLTPIKQQLLAHAFEYIVRYFDDYSLGLVGSVSVSSKLDSGKNLTLTPENYPEYGRQRARDITGHLYRSGTVNIQKYECGVGGYPHWHSEQYPQLNDYEALHRVALYMFYLNDVNEGGETEFYYQGRSLQPEQGTMVIAPAGFTHSHRGNIPLSNDKYIATSWVMFNRAEKLYK